MALAIPAAWRDPGFGKAPEREMQVRNLLTLRLLNHARHLRLRSGGPLYRVPPVPFELGMELFEAKELYRQAEQADDRAGIRKHSYRMMALGRRCLHPTGWRRLVWRLTPNPLRLLSNLELLETVDFLLLCRMKSGIQYQYPQDPSSLT